MCSAVIMSYTFGVLVVVALLVARACDMFSFPNGVVAILDLFFNHFDDACDQPLGVLAEIFWIVTLVTLVLFYFFTCSYANRGNCDCSCLLLFFSV